MVLGAWNGLTGESLDHEDAKVVLLGLRRHQWERCGAAPDEGGAEGGTQEGGQGGPGGTRCLRLFIRPP